MLLLVTGSSCSGKTTLARTCTGIDNLAVHDCDEHGVPSTADTAWRQDNLRHWVRRALTLQQDGIHLLLTSQSPIGELLAVPEAENLPVAVCLVDVEDDVRLQRLEQRDPGKWSPDDKHAFIEWGRWHRRHAHDPTHHPEAITENSAPWMRWDRWQAWTADHPAWNVHTIDTTHLDAASAASLLSRWVRGHATRV